MSSENIGQEVVEIFTKLCKINFLWNVLQITFCNFLAQISKFAIWMVDGTRYQTQAFQGFS